MICAALAFLTNGTPALAQDAVVKKIIEIGKNGQSGDASD